MLYLFACTVVLPITGRFDYTLVSPELYYWSAGLLLITVAASVRIGARRLFAVPPSAMVLLVVATLSAVRGLMEGTSISYVLRQFYGFLLLFVYFAIALHIGGLELLLRRISTFGFLVALCFFGYYIAVFAEYGFHKEMGDHGTLAMLLAVVLFITGVERRKGSWVLRAAVMLLVPILFFMRKDVLTFLMGLLAALAMNVKSRTLRFLACSLFILVALPAIFSPVAEMVGQELVKLPVIGGMIPEGSRDSATLLDRNLQLAAAVSIVRSHPLLGTGLGTELAWESPFRGSDSVAYVDSGWGYLLQKTGLLGTAAFLWYLITILRCTSRKCLALSSCLLTLGLVTLFTEPIFVRFATAPFVGTFAGLLYAHRWGLPRMPIAGQPN